MKTTPLLVTMAGVLYTYTLLCYMRLLPAWVCIRLHVAMTACFLVTRDVVLQIYFISGCKYSTFSIIECDTIFVNGTGLTSKATVYDLRHVSRLLLSVT